MDNDKFAFDHSEVDSDHELKMYNRIKLMLASQLGLFRDVLKKCGDEARDRQCYELIVKLAEDSFTIAVLGQFKRGKSSLINAIIGRELLPTGVLPLTSAITVLRFGSEERLVIERTGSQLLSEVAPVSQIDDYVTERRNPSNRKNIKTATLEVPLPFLRRGLEFVDTPGVGSTITSNTATTYAFIPQCDAALFVTSVESPFTSIELELLKQIRQYVHKIFFIVNKIDLLEEHERSDVLEFTTKTIREQMGTDDIRIFPVSCKVALATRTSDTVGYARSGLKELQTELARFLSDEKTATFLSAIAERALRLLDIDVSDPRLNAIRNNIAALQNEIMGLPPDSNAQILRSPPMVATFLPVKGETNLTGQLLFTDPTRALHTRGCPICDGLYQVVFDFFAKWQYELSTNEKSQIEFANGLGFCPLHTWQLEKLSSPVGSSISYSRLTEHVSQLLLQAAESSHPEQAVAALIQGMKNCRVCSLLRESEKKQIEKLATFLAQEDGREAYLHSQGLCLHHLALLVSTSGNREVVQFLLSHSAHSFEEVAEDMRAFAMKTDALRRYLSNEDEQDAYLRAIIHLVGSRSICIPWSSEDEK